MDGLHFAAMFQPMSIVFAVLYTATYDGNVATTERLSILQRMELLLNTSISSINQRIDSMESEMKSSIHSAVETAMSQNMQSILQHMELLNTSISSMNQRIDSMESELKSSIHSAVETAMSQNMQSMETRIDLLLETQKSIIVHNNISQTTLNEVYKKLNPEDPVKSSSPRSCAEVLKNSPSSLSGYYNLADANGRPQSVYCYMDNLCNSGGGWKRVTKLDMTNSNENCPTGLRLYHQDGGRACGRQESNIGSCSGTIFPVNYEYSQVCGKVIGYQKGHPDGPHGNDRVSLTHGTTQSHIWSFFAAPSEKNRDLTNCPCSSSGARDVPSFIGSDYYCESARTILEPLYLDRLFTNDPLWDGKNCNFNEEPCCNGPLIPWFHKKLGYTTTDYIEMKFCFDQNTDDEDSPVFQYEIYVK